MKISRTTDDFGVRWIEIEADEKKYSIVVEAISGVVFSNDERPRVYVYFDGRSVPILCSQQEFKALEYAIRWEDDDYRQVISDEVKHDS